MLLTSEIQNQRGERGQEGRHMGAVRTEGEKVTLSTLRHRTIDSRCRDMKLGGKKKEMNNTLH